MNSLLMTKQTNLLSNSHITLDALLYACSIYNINRGVLGTTVNPDTWYVWTVEFDSNTLRVDANIFESATKNIRIQKYPDTCGWGLILSIHRCFFFFYRTFIPEWELLCKRGMNSVCRTGMARIPVQYLPEYFHNYFLMTNEVHSYNTRSAKSYYLPLCRTNIRQFSIKYKGPTFFSTLSFDISNYSTVSTFKIKASKLSTLPYLNCISQY